LQYKHLRALSVNELTNLDSNNNFLQNPVKLPANAFSSDIVITSEHASLAINEVAAPLCKDDLKGVHNHVNPQQHTEGVVRFVENDIPHPLSPCPFVKLRVFVRNHSFNIKKTPRMGRSLCRKRFPHHHFPLTSCRSAAGGEREGGLLHRFLQRGKHLRCSYSQHNKSNKITSHSSGKGG